MTRLMQVPELYMRIVGCLEFGEATRPRTGFAARKFGSSEVRLRRGGPRLNTIVACQIF